MMRVKKNKVASGTLLTIVSVLVLSGVLRLGGIGIAVANEAEVVAVNEADGRSYECEMSENTQELLRIITARTAELDAKELELMEQSAALDAAKQLIEKNLVQLEEAELRLQATIDQVDGASADDIDRLTSVYESMKPKVAAALFEQMSPEFAAGFLGRMNPPAAAEIMSGLSSEAGYAISVVLAGRNANVPTQ